MTESKFARYQGWALITGASSGIGAEFARQLAAEGIDCVLAARREERLRELAGELESQHGVQTRCVPVDLSEEQAASVLAEAVNDIPIGMLINNAGFGDTGRFVTRDSERVANMVKVNCLAPAVLTRAIVPGMVERGTGAVITVGSVLSILPCPYESLYSATKAFDLLFSEGLRYELKGTGIDVLAICPGITDTEFLTSQGFGAEEAKRVSPFAASPRRIVRIALRALGRKSATGPIDFIGAAFLMRIFPRTWVAALVGRVMRQRMRKKEAESQ